MPTATLTYNLPQERNEHQLALDGAAWYGVTWAMREWLHRQAKHAGTKAEGEIYRTVLVQLEDEIDSRNLDAEAYS